MRSEKKINKEIENEVFEIDISGLFSIFSKHININNNSKILFSGKFGIGKTCFLIDYFEENKDRYEVFHLYPVNYQISSNEDIIEFLKYDILVELLKEYKGIFEEHDYFSFMDLEQLLYLWGKENLNDILKRGFSYLGKLGRPLNDILDLMQSFSEFKKKMEAGEMEYINKFLTELKSKKISETDLISDLIKNKLTKLKEGGKEIVLILDDLERIDPEHIFRILNIFSACSDKEDVNKFGFDKIILVADYNNLKSIFHHKYGEKTDASGYFDKFFSIEIFQFDNTDVIINIVDNIISQFILEDKENLAEAMNKDGFLGSFLKDILIKSIKLSGKEKINLRQLLKGTKFSLNSLKNNEYQEGLSYSRDKTVPYFMNISIITLVSLFGGLKNDFLSVLKEIKFKFELKKNSDDDLNFYQLLSFYLLRKVDPNAGFTEDSFNYKWNNYSITIKDKQVINSSTKIDSGTNGSDFIIKFLYYDLLIEYVEKEYYLERIEINK